MEPSLCTNGCGFYGSAENRNMCSKCYKDFLKRELIEKLTNIVDDEDEAKSASTTENQAVSAENDVVSNSDIHEAVTAKLGELKIERKRCKECNKKVGLTGFGCRCGGLYCGKHRLPEYHSCRHHQDFRAAARNNLKLQLVAVKADRLKHRLD